MSLAIGSLSLVSVSSSQALLQAPAATGGTSPYSYQWYRSTTSGFSPGGGNIIGSAQTPSGTAQPAVFTDPTVLTPGTIYYYKVVVTDSASATATSAQLTVTTLAATLSQNQFTITPYLGMTDLPYNINTVSMQFDPAGTGTLSSGMAVKWSTNAGAGLPMIVPSTAASDVVVGFVNFNIKDVSYSPGNILEISMAGNVMYLYAALAITRGQFLTSLPAAVAGGCNGGVVPVTGSSGFPIIGYALGNASIGSLTRVFIQTPAAPYAID